MPARSNQSLTENPMLAMQEDADEDAPVDPPLPRRDEAEDVVREYGYSEDVGVPQDARRREVREALESIQSMLAASLEDSWLAEATVHRLRFPPHAVPEISPFERAGSRAEMPREISTKTTIKRKITEVTGVDAMRTAMCVNSCVAYTGPFSELDSCPLCLEPRYDAYHLARSQKVPRRTFLTFPLGPQIQAMYASPETAQLMHHRSNRTREIRDQLTQDPDALGSIDDIYRGSDYLREVELGRITDDDTVLMFSLDGAQLYSNKSSDCWFFIWVLLDLPPEMRYKKQYVLPAMSTAFLTSYWLNQTYECVGGVRLLVHVASST
ncbi:hypothetical protein BN946_scf184858.g37 [Trametes cinnabarina]|uniref:Uncharacterized protein n=1 Tax=Pycnoporus cinnabarinus TaxID=5643 RepID=A0A060SM44_PYCCI|nr:hypothetical protein BN946_scf184858.g37 [Trametes cinnabarina]